MNGHGKAGSGRAWGGWVWLGMGKLGLAEHGKAGIGEVGCGWWEGTGTRDMKLTSERKMMDGNGWHSLG